MRKRLLRHKFSASYTIEAAFIFPVIFFVVIILIEYSFYCHDRGKVQAYLNDLSRRAAHYITYEVDLETGNINYVDILNRGMFDNIFPGSMSKVYDIWSYAQKEVNESLIISHVNLGSVDLSLTRVKITGTFCSKLSMLKLLPWGLDDEITVSFEHSESIFAREEKARLLDAVISVGQKVKGVNDIVDKLSELINKVH